METLKEEASVGIVSNSLVASTVNSASMDTSDHLVYLLMQRSPVYVSNLKFVFGHMYIPGTISVGGSSWGT